MDCFFLCDENNGSAMPLGGKARALWNLGRAGFPVPRWLAVLPGAFTRSVQLDPAKLADADTAMTALSGITLAPELAEELVRMLGGVAPDGKLWAVRSSAADEDGGEHSFAGQLESYLEVPSDEVAMRVADVWRSGFSRRVFSYRRERGLPLPPPLPSVIVQAQIPADLAGVAFSADAVSGRRKVAVVAAVRGLGEQLVSGAVNADTFKINLAGQVIERALEDSKKPVLSDDQAVAIAGLARKAEAHFGRPQDIEWAMADGNLFMLQSRPITSLGQIADPDSTLLVWDNSNISESYCGVTTPLTYSFARYIYEEVYWQFCRLLGVPESRLEVNADLFGRMLGLIRGRIYYSMLDWYRALALLPGFAFNRQFMEQMMGVKESMPSELVRQFEEIGLGARLGDLLHLFSTVVGLVVASIRMPKVKRRFQARVQRALQPPSRPLESYRADELTAYYRDIERQLLTRWDAPMVNDFFAMVYFGVLRKLCASWLGTGGESLANDLVSGTGGMVSTEPARRVEEMAAIASSHPKLVETLTTAPPQEALAIALAHPQLGKSLAEYFELFGDRCMEELKLESPTLREEPEALLRSVGRLAGVRGGAPRTRYDARGAAEKRVQRALAGKILRRWFFTRILRKARQYVRDRENLRLDRTRLFARIREIFKALGAKFVADNVLERPRDIFFLTVQEALAFVEGTAVTTDLKALVALRCREFEAFRVGPPPADRFETRGVVYVGNPFQSSGKLACASGQTATGLACCPGIVRGPARVVRDPRGVTMTPGEILVAERTDPGWVMLFPSAAGLIVEHGSLLSHSAIVARELGLPAVVAVNGATEWLVTGDLVELDGATGLVRKLTTEQDDDQ
jgi:pyruvate,water dikinase